MTSTSFHLLSVKISVKFLSKSLSLYPLISAASHFPMYNSWLLLITSIIFCSNCVPTISAVGFLHVYYFLISAFIFSIWINWFCIKSLIKITSFANFYSWDFMYSRTYFWLSLNTYSITFNNLSLKFLNSTVTTFYIYELKLSILPLIVFI